MYEICNGFTSDPDCAINDVIKSNLVMQIFSLVYSHTLLKKFGHIIMIIAEQGIWLQLPIKVYIVDDCLYYWYTFTMDARRIFFNAQLVLGTVMSL